MYLLSLKCRLLHKKSMLQSHNVLDHVLESIINIYVYVLHKNSVMVLTMVKIKSASENKRGWGNLEENHTLPYALPRSQIPSV